MQKKVFLFIIVFITAYSINCGSGSSDSNNESGFVQQPIASDSITTPTSSNCRHNINFTGVSNYSNCDAGPNCYAIVYYGQAADGNNYVGIAVSNNPVPVHSFDKDYSANFPSPEDFNLKIYFQWKDEQPSGYFEYVIDDTAVIKVRDGLPNTTNILNIGSGNNGKKLIFNYDDSNYTYTITADASISLDSGAINLTGGFYIKALYVNPPTSK